MRRVKEEVDDAGVIGRLAVEQLDEQLGDLRADACESRNGGKQRIENGRAHGRKMR